MVDGHAYLGFTYDYLATRQGWHGVDGNNGRIFSMVNVERGFDNALYAYPPLGPERLGVLAFGETEDGSAFVSADAVAHELMHGVTHHSVLQRTGTPLLDTDRAVPGPSSFTVEDEVHECGRSYTWTNAIIETNGGGGSSTFGAKKAAICWLRTRAAPSMKPGRTCSAPPSSSWCTSRGRVRYAQTTWLVRTRSRPSATWRARPRRRWKAPLGL